MLSLIFGGAGIASVTPKLRRLIVDLIDKENWTAYDSDVKGDAYEGLLEKTGAGLEERCQSVFYPRPLIRAIVEVLRPQPMHFSAQRRVAPVGSCWASASTPPMHKRS